MQHGIDAVELAGGAQPCLPLGEQAGEEGVVHRAVRFGHGEGEGHGFPGAGGVHGGDEARQFAQHARGGGAGLGEQVGAGEQGAGGEVRLGGLGGEAVALDREAEQGNSWRGHSEIPSSPASSGVALRPLPVSTRTVVSCGAIRPAARSLAKAADGCAAVGST